MIEVKNGNVVCSGNELDILADFGITAKALNSYFEADKIIEVCLLGLYAKDRSAMDKIHEILKAGGMKV